MTEEPCLHKMRNGECLLPKGHKTKRHTTVVFYCEACGEARPGHPFAIEEVRLGDGSVDDEFHFCFLCVKKSQKFPRWMRIGQ